MSMCAYRIECQKPCHAPWATGKRTADSGQEAHETRNASLLLLAEPLGDHVIGTYQNFRIFRIFQAFFDRAEMKLFQVRDYLNLW